MNNGYAICFNEWALDKDIKNELGLLLIISSLCAEKGYCYASNKYFSDLFNSNETSISRKIKLLEKKNYIKIDYIKKGTLVTERYIRLSKMITDRYQNCQSTVIKNDKENNISINNTIKENIKRKVYFFDNEINSLFLELLDLRIKLKCKNTDRAINLLLNELNKYDNSIKKEMLKEAILKSWKSVYPPRNIKTNNSARTNQFRDITMEVLNDNGQ